MLFARTSLTASLVIAVVALTPVAVEPQRSTPPRPAALTRDYAVRPVEFTAVHLNDVFWAPRIETNRVETIPFAFQQCELSGRAPTDPPRAKPFPFAPRGWAVWGPAENSPRGARGRGGEPLENTKPPGY